MVFDVLWSGLDSPPGRSRSGAGKLKGGRHIKYGEPKPLANLRLTLLDRVGVRLDSFADSQSKVTELLSV